ncbi:MAG: substrate-binding periplasmic protein [Cognaticolwellia sp.]
MTTLKTSYYRQNIAPQLFFDSAGKPTHGILFDITHAIAKNLNTSLEMIAIPRKRITQALIDNTIDMHCLANPLWYQQSSLQWSKVIYKNPDFLINNKGLNSLQELAYYQQLKIGTSLGYVYPELAPYLKNNNIRRVDSLTPEQSYKKYQRKQLAGFIIPKVEASFLTKSTSDSVVILNNNDIHCVFSPNVKKATVDQINQAITQLKTSGKLTAIFAEYSRVH